MGYKVHIDKEMILHIIVIITLINYIFCGSPEEDINLHFYLGDFFADNKGTEDIKNIMDSSLSENRMYALQPWTGIKPIEPVKPIEGPKGFRSICKIPGTGSNPGEDQRNPLCD